MNTQKTNNHQQNMYCEQALRDSGNVESLRQNWRNKSVTLDDERFGKCEIKLIYHQAFSTGEIEPPLQS